jgi:hypothetical protein
MKIYGIGRRDMRTCAWGCCTLNKSPNAAVGNLRGKAPHGEALGEGPAATRSEDCATRRKERVRGDGVTTLCGDARRSSACKMSRHLFGSRGVGELDLEA